MSISELANGQIQTIIPSQWSVAQNDKLMTIENARNYNTIHDLMMASDN